MKANIINESLFDRSSRLSNAQQQLQGKGLYDASYEHDACGVGMLVNIQGGKSHELVDSALKLLENMKHRGAEGADNKTGDGAGILLQIPHEFILLQGIPVPEKGKYGTGMFFFPKDEQKQADYLNIIRTTLADKGLELMHVRQVPVDSSVLGKDALAVEPDIKQLFVTAQDGSEVSEQTLYIVRKEMERLISDPEFYVVSLSAKTDRKSVV